MNEKQRQQIQVLIQEYRNSSQLYSNTIAVTYTRIWGFLAVHAGLFTSFFLIKTLVPMQIISIIGFCLAILSILTTTHVFQVTKFRISQAIEIEKALSKLLEENIPTTFRIQDAIFSRHEWKEKEGQKNVLQVEVGDEGSFEYKAGCFERFLIKRFPYQADKVVLYAIMVAWFILLIIIFKFPDILLAM